MPGAVEGAAPPAALEDDESLDDGAALEVPVELAGGVEAVGAAGGVVGAVDCVGGVAFVSDLPSSLPHADSARATAAAKSQELLFMKYPFVDKS